MTIDAQARRVLEPRGLDRDHLLIGAKALAQQMIEQSASSEHPLQSMVYDVWGLYNDGLPKCRLTTTDDGDLVFTAQFHTEDDDVHAVRRQAVSVEELERLCNPGA
ncbi:hypothetical protein CRI93_11535 [Longimonas halophila]|uniref:Uncharacterized protein n=1 Tax=Longimonas halophila TaxID=1469170 RepID=A0A2H3NJQ6_9BACT|nr:hypothetical protein [Longimonas halophila]PEN05732.1 hypothetical protein CRI93_11535 [Longimonas halophila]